MKHLFSYNLYSLICLLFLSACQKEEQEAIYNRTLLVYLARDNNLSGTSEEKKTCHSGGMERSGRTGGDL